MSCVWFRLTDQGMLYQVISTIKLRAKDQSIPLWNTTLTLFMTCVEEEGRGREKERNKGRRVRERGRGKIERRERERE